MVSRVVTSGTSGNCISPLKTLSSARLKYLWTLAPENLTDSILAKADTFSGFIIIGNVRSVRSTP